MKLFLGLVLLVAFVYVVSADIDSEWEAYKTKFNKSYISPEMEQYRKTQFKKEFEKVERHNEKFGKGQVSYELKISDNADMNRDEKRRGAYNANVLAIGVHPVEY